MVGNVQCKGRVEGDGTQNSRRGRGVVGENLRIVGGERGHGGGDGYMEN